MENSKISVIVPIFNAERYLAKCINSILKQSYKNFELILVNDCSTDGSLGICEKFAKSDKRIVIIDKKKNEKVELARMDGIQKATGGFLCFTDSDDFLQASALENLM